MSFQLLFLLLLQLSAACAPPPAAAAESVSAPLALWAPPPAPHPPTELPSHWDEQLPSFQQDWIRKTLFRAHPKTGKPELVSQLKLWWYPPQAPLIHSQPPASPDAFFVRPLFLWMPHKMWSIPLVCVQPACSNHKLTAAGIYRTVRRVLDIDGWYDMATEYLECKRCKKKYPGWSESVLRQLDMGHRCQFPAILTYRYSCDYRVIRMMRERTQGNSVTQLYKKLNEEHSEVWTQRALQYLTACDPFVSFDAVERPHFHDPPRLPALPKPKWLLSVYSRDVLSRLDEVKAKITSVFGSILKMDSTKKVTKKLAGAAAHTAAWCTNVGNEHGQVLCSVLTAAEGHGLWPMAKGLQRRYREAGVAPPAVMYVDRDCCSLHGRSQVKAMFSEWSELQVRLDIWHFMRRFAAGVTTEAHPLYGIFMAGLSRCIFEWDPEDVAALRKAKQGERLADGMGVVSERALNERITRRELARHCRRRTRGVEETTKRIKALIDLMDGECGKDTLGVPLLNHERIQQIWKDQQRHIACIQDPPKGGVELSTYRCARGSTSLESFHLHLNRFIPGTSASVAHFQAYLLEGLMRWNEDRMDEAVKAGSTLWTYNSAQREALDRLSRKILGKSLVDNYRPPGAYTGELLGIEYLYSQTGKALTVIEAGAEEDRLVEEMEDEQEDQDEGFVEENTEDMTVPVLFEPEPSESSEQSSSSTLHIHLPRQCPTNFTTTPSTAPHIHPPRQCSTNITTTPSTALHIWLPSKGHFTTTTTTISTALHIWLPSKGHFTTPPPQSPQPSTSSRAERLPASPQPVTELDSSSGSVTPESSVTEQPPAPVLGPDGVAGWDKVQDLATHLVSLREAPYLTEQQVTETIRLWSALPEGDKKRLSYQPRHQAQLTHGRFKAPKGAQVTPGVESVKRCLIGHPGGPAQRPSTSRIVEAMCTKLCALHRSPTKKDGVTVPRWSKILSDYHHIRDLVLNCPAVMEATSLQLFVLNQRTLLKWFQKKENSQELSVLQQGLAAEDRIVVASSQLPVPRERLEEIPSTSGPPHHFDLPPNRAGQAPKLRPGRKRASATAVQPIAPAAPLLPSPAPPQLVFPLPVPPVLLSLSLPASTAALPGAVPSQRLLLPAPTASPAPVVLGPPAPTAAPAVSRFTEYTRRRKAEEEASGVHKRKYVRGVAFNTCSKCGQPKTKEFGHSRFHTAFYCAQTSGGQTLEQWLAEQRLKKQTGGNPPT
ncbi:hypothetical protein WMY93_000355 [Mugilogobius chulae]|uniref:DUF6729 domain-containing protein n=1 Tax=Mugilogobius chulae TaxID=88201 RepID=A0AAW0Q252_9GOBI